MFELEGTLKTFCSRKNENNSEELKHHATCTERAPPADDVRFGTPLGVIFKKSRPSPTQTPYFLRRAGSVITETTELHSRFRGVRPGHQGFGERAGPELFRVLRCPHVHAMKFERRRTPHDFARYVRGSCDHDDRGSCECWFFSLTNSIKEVLNQQTV